MGQENERPGLQYRQHAQGLAQAVERQQAASRDAIHWQDVADKTEDRNARRYFEGMVKLSALKALHHNLIAESYQRGRHEGDAAFNLHDEGKTHTTAREPASRVKPSSEITLIEKGRDKALAEYGAHDAKAEAFALLAGRYRELGNEGIGRTYDERARLESASARVFRTVIKSYDKKVEQLGNATVAKDVCPDFRSSFRALEQAERYLKDHNNGYAMVRNHTRRVLENERRIQKLEAACENRPQDAVEHRLLKDAVDRGEKLKWLAETEAFDTVASYKNFQKEIESAEKTYDAISRALRGKPAELSKIKEPELDKPGLQVNGSDPNGAANSGHRQHGPGVGAVVSQILNEMDREI